MAIFFFAQYVWCGLPAEPAAAVKTFIIAEMIKEKSNNRPRKKMGFLTPYEYFFSTFAKINV